MIQCRRSSPALDHCGLASATNVEIMLTQCIDCGFYVRKNDEFCLNCGFLRPAEKQERERFNYVRAILIFFPLLIITFLILFILSAVSIPPPKDLSIFFASIGFLSFIISLVLAVVFTKVLGIFDKNHKLKARKNANKDNLNTK